jgi:hypothetical protein
MVDDGYIVFWSGGFWKGLEENLQEGCEMEDIWISRN